MDIKSREVVVTYVDEIKLTPEQWDTRGHGVVGWRLHMAKILNQRVVTLAPRHSDPIEFYKQLIRFADEIGYGEQATVIAVTERIYNIRLRFEEAA